MPTVESETLIAVGIDDAFALSQSYGLRLTWDPFVRGQSLLDGATTAARGVKTLTISRHGLRMVTEYISFRRPELVAMKMLEGPWMFRLFSGSWQFETRAEGSTHVRFKYHFECQPVWLQPVMHPVVQRVLGREIRVRLDAFRRAAESPGMLDRLHAEQAEHLPAQ